MARDTENANLNGVDAVVTQIRNKLPADQAQTLEAFCRQFFSQVDSEDLAQRRVEDLYGSLLSQWQFIRKFPHQEDAGARRSRVRLFNPRLKEHGWESSHTIIEILSEDMPFLVDSIVMEVNRQGLSLHLIIHPVMKIIRDPAGQFLMFGATEEADGGHYESIIHVEVDRRSDAAELEALTHGLQQVLDHVRNAVQDWPAMRQRLAHMVADIERVPPPGSPADVAESVAFLRWIADDNFVLLGCRDYDLHIGDQGITLDMQANSGLGILRTEDEQRQSLSFASLAPGLKALALHPTLLTVSKANTRSTVHRPGYLDYIGVRTFDAQGQVTGERRILGLMTSVAYHASPSRIPLLRHKVAAVAAQAGFMPGSHAAKALATLLEQYPRDELFQISADELYHHALAILRLGERQRIRLLLRHDPFGRFVSCLIYVPREIYNTEQRERMQSLLLATFDGSSAEFDVQFSGSALARILIIIRTRAGIPDYDPKQLEAQLIRVSRRWQDDLQQALVEHYGEERGMALKEQYADAFPAGYREDTPPRLAVQDIEQMESLAPQSAGLAMATNLYVPLEAAPGQLRFKICRADAPVLLSTSLPMLEHMGVKVMEERPAQIQPRHGRPIWIHDFGLTYCASEELDLENRRPLFEETFQQVCLGQAENDDFNRLVLLAGLNWREVLILRAYARHMKLATFPFSQAYKEQALAAQPQLARLLVELFKERFDPEREQDRAARVQARVAEIHGALDQVANLDEDRILRQFLAMIQATLRSNYFQEDAQGRAKPHISFKFDPKGIPGLPEPRPMFEIFVYSPRFEGVHLRGGRVARGGLRWSDRMEDFRTEVLGLMKAQMVKNTVIVPVGSKGGFIVKNPPPSHNREAVMAEGIACYRAYLHGLLDLTDNLVAGQVVPPPQVVRYDGDDPYLVVAADKGTASFSDYANAVSAEYGFWLGDAFASGGSVGYDHKKMAITARGAWESVKRHFRELGIDTQNEDFSVVGIGDMSGDVFGNGMLLSRHIKLVAAFDHRHIFIDPTPDPLASFQERQRLFALPRSSWDDFDKSLISTGGGVWPRSAKSIALSDQARALLAIDQASLTPAELIHAILVAPVDLLYNGGIGTYVKAASESHAAVGDRANDSIRADGGELRCRVVCEGGNLGFTQLGRIEYALQGGRNFTDAIDNSAGVDCSDHEVNIKILLNSVMLAGDMTEKQRHKLLADMTDEVGQLVLADNYYQTQVLAIGRTQAASLVEEQSRYLRQLGNSGRLNRKLEFLPFEEELSERKSRHQGLTAPEQAVLLAYAKIELFDLILASNVPEDQHIAQSLFDYFPVPLRLGYAEQIRQHPLKREIITTYVVNNLVNRVGSTFVFQIQEETGAPAPDIVRAFLASRQAFGLAQLWDEIESLDGRIANSAQTAMILQAGRLLQRASLWFLRHRENLGDLSTTLSRFAPGIAQLASALDLHHGPGILPSQYRADLDSLSQQYQQQGVPPALASRVAGLEALYAALDLVEVSSRTGHSMDLAAGVYFELGSQLDLYWLGQQVAALPADSHWQGLARTALRDDLSSLMRDLTGKVLANPDPSANVASLSSAWLKQQQFQIERCRQLLSDIRNTRKVELPMLSVLLRELRGLV